MITEREQENARASFQQQSRLSKRAVTHTQPPGWSADGVAVTVTATAAAAAGRQRGAFPVRLTDWLLAWLAGL